VVRSLFEQHSSGRNNNYKILFSLVVFEEWLRARRNPVGPSTIEAIYSPYPAGVAQ